jgi:hypothetical protein
MMKFRKRSLAALVLTASALILGTSLPASATTGTDGFTILHLNGPCSPDRNELSTYPTQISYTSNSGCGSAPTQTTMCG